MSGQDAKFAQLLETVRSDREQARSFLERPVSTMRQAGISVPPEASDQSLAEQFAKTDDPVIASVRDLARDGQASAMETDACARCRAWAQGVAIALIGMGVLGIETLTAGSAIVIAVAEYFEIAPEAALPLVKSVITMLSAGAGAVATEICERAGACG
jgi:hypothetical protein